MQWWAILGLSVFTDLLYVPVAFALFQWWWVEYVAALVFLFWLAGETREAIEEARGEKKDEP
jgi:hypothetical protein